MKFKTFAEALTAERLPKAANDNNPPRKSRQPRYRGTLPALRWLFDNHPDLAPALASAMPKPSTNWHADAEDSRQEIRPTVGELMKAAEGSTPIIEADEDGERITLGSLKFRDGRLVEWGATKKGHKLRPVDRVKAAGGGTSSTRSPKRYLETKATTPSPMHAAHLARNVSDRPVLPPMYDPQTDVEDNRELLRSLGIDGSVRFDKLPVPATECEDAVAKGAGFLGGGHARAGTRPVERRPGKLPKSGRARSRRSSKKSPHAVR